MIKLKPGDKIWLANAPTGWGFETNGPTVIFDLSEYGVDPMIAVDGYKKMGWTVVAAVIQEETKETL